VRIKAGETVRWRNASDVVHTVTADPSLAAKAENVRLPEGAAKFHSGDIKPGGQFTHTFPVAGEYTYFCQPHELAGMVAKIIVEKREAQ
jgi:plastocyanin